MRIQSFQLKFLLTKQYKTLEFFSTFLESHIKVKNKFIYISLFLNSTKILLYIYVMT